MYNSECPWPRHCISTTGTLLHKMKVPHLLITVMHSMKPVWLTSAGQQTSGHHATYNPCNLQVTNGLCAHVSVCVHVGVCTSMYLCLSLHLYLSVYACTCMYACVCVCVCVCVCYVYICMHVMYMYDVCDYRRTCICVSVHPCVCLCVCVCVCVCVCQKGFSPLWKLKAKPGPTSLHILPSPVSAS